MIKRRLRYMPWSVLNFMDIVHSQKLARMSFVLR